jgi:hypothetical protein
MTWEGANLDRRGGKPATNSLSYGTAREHININTEVYCVLES